MRIKYNFKKLKEILNDLSVLTGITIDFLDADGRAVCLNESCNDFCSVIQGLGQKRLCAEADSVLLERCKKSGSYESHICHAGLYDSAMPIIKAGITAGYIIMGRIRTPNSGDSFPYADNSRLSELYSQLPLFNNTQLKSLRTLLSNILFSSAIEIEYNETIEEIARYIKENLKSELSLEHICSKFFISKNRLYKGFKEHYGSTVNEFITEARLEAAKALLSETEIPIYAICEKIGIDNYTYFSKLFKKKVGTSPTKYRRCGTALS